MDSMKITIEIDEKEIMGGIVKAAFELDKKYRGHRN